jgi:hypothetical protein
MICSTRTIEIPWCKTTNALEVVQFLCEHLSNLLESSYIGKKKPVQKNF